MNLRSFDFFRKVHSDIESSTLSGGVFSVLALIVFNLFFSWGFIYLFRNINIFKVKKFQEKC